MNYAGDRRNLKRAGVYQVYGLTFQSELELPELSLAQSRDIDAEVVLGHVPFKLANSSGRYGWIEFSDRSCLLKIKNIGRFLIEDGNSITIDRREDRTRRRASGTPAPDIRAYLLGSCFGALLHQRGWLPMHVGAVHAKNGVWAFTGASGAGKSTLTAWLHRQLGLPIVCDDVGVIRQGDKAAKLYPGPNKLKLCEDALDHFGFKESRCLQDLTNTSKYQVYLENSQVLAPEPIRSLVILEPHADGAGNGLTRIRGAQAFPYIMSAIYRPLMAWKFRQGADLANDVIRLCNKIEVYTLNRRWGLSVMEKELQPLVEKILA